MARLGNLRNVVRQELVARQLEGAVADLLPARPLTVLDVGCGQGTQALRTGDERHLPARDRGPVRRYVRDIVDARRSVAEFFLPLAFLILVLIWVGNEQLKAVGNALWLAVVLLVVVDSVVLALRLRRGLRRRFPDESHRGAVPYALMRSMQIRRFRLPPPRVRAGRRRSRRG